jgi:sulfotransferase family protein
VTLAAEHLIERAVEETGLEDFGGDSFREGLTRLVGSLSSEADLTELGEQILGLRLGMLLANRLRVHDFLQRHPEIADEQIEGPLFIIGLPRTGTTALSQLVAGDPQIRSLRLWESSDPIPPPESSTEHTDPRIADAERGLEAMYDAFSRMRSLYFQTATAPTECQDLLGMEFRTEHFDGMARVPSYAGWALACDMGPAYQLHRRVLQLLQWHCPPRLWHLKTPVHMLSLDALHDVYPEARFLWTHRDPAEVLGSVCSLISYTRSWVSDRDDAGELGAQQLEVWAEAVRRALDFRSRVGEEAFADVAFDELHSDPVGAVERAYARVGLGIGAEGRARIGRWASDHPPGSHGTHEFALSDFGLDAGVVRGRFADYRQRFGLPGPAS